MAIIEILSSSTIVNQIPVTVVSPHDKRWYDNVIVILFYTKLSLNYRKSQRLNTA